MRFFALTWPFAFGVRLGWMTSTAKNPALSEARGRVYLLRGNGVVFSRGFGLLCERLRQAGIWAEDLRCVGDRWVRRHLLADHKSGRLRGPVILVGHSCGGRYALFTAQEMAVHGIVVDLLICVDAALPYDVAGNVKHAVHLYRTHKRLYPARPLRRAIGSTAEISNIDLDAEHSPIRAEGLHHLNITGSAEVQAWIVRRIVETVGDGADGQAGTEHVEGSQ